MVCLFAKFQEWRDDRRGMRNLVSVHGRFLCDAETLQSVILQTFICYNVHVTGGGGGGGGGGGSTRNYKETSIFLCFHVRKYIKALFFHLVPTLPPDG